MTELAVFSDNYAKSISLIKVVLMSARNNQNVNIMHSLFNAIIRAFIRLQMCGAPHP